MQISSLHYCVKIWNTAQAKALQPHRTGSNQLDCCMHSYMNANAKLTLRPTCLSRIWQSKKSISRVNVALVQQWWKYLHSSASEITFSNFHDCQLESELSSGKLFRAAPLRLWRADGWHQRRRRGGSPTARSEESSVSNRCSSESKEHWVILLTETELILTDRWRDGGCLITPKQHWRAF